MTLRGVGHVVLAASFISGLLLPFAALAQQFPAPDPPVLESTADEELAPRARTLGIASPDFVTEWTLHKTADGAHPDGVEQAYLWLMNRARRDPVAEGLFLAATGDARVQGAISFFGVNLTLLRQEFAAIAPKPPAAFDVRLYEAALAHSLDLIARDAQDHNEQFTRVTASGGGYAIPMLDAGPVEVRFDVEGLAPFTAAVDVPATSVLLDFLVTPALALPVPEPGPALSALAAALALAALGKGRRVS